VERGEGDRLGEKVENPELKLQRVLQKEPNANNDMMMGIGIVHSALK
jgi:hypothetical protein